MRTTIEPIQSAVVQLVRVLEADFAQPHGFMTISRVATLLSACRSANLKMALCEQTTPQKYFNSEWFELHETLQDYETRLARIIKGVAVPIDDHERE